MGLIHVIKKAKTSRDTVKEIRELKVKLIKLFLFRIKHFAGSVTYSVQGFLAKNNDSLEGDLSRFMYHCQHPLLKLLFPEGIHDIFHLKKYKSSIFYHF